VFLFGPERPWRGTRPSGCWALTSLRETHPLFCWELLWGHQARDASVQTPEGDGWKTFSPPTGLMATPFSLKPLVLQLVDGT